MRTTSGTSIAATASPVDVARWAVPIGLALLCLAAYANSFGVGFALDNRQLILNDPRVHAVTPDNLRLILDHSYWWPYGESGLYRPLTTASYLLNYALLGNGRNPAGYHQVNLLLHITNVLLLWRIVLRVTGRRWTAACAAAIWAVVPLSTEAVTNIVGRADLMAATATCSAILLYLQIRRGTPGGSDPSRRTGNRSSSLDAVRWAGIGAAVLLGVSSKESAVSIVGVLLLIELAWWSRRESPRRLAVLAIVAGVPLAFWAVQRAAVLRAAGPAVFPFTDNPIAGAPFWQGRLTAVEVMWRYVALLLWPAHLSADYSYPQIPLARGTAIDWIACLLIVTGIVAALWQARRSRAVVFFAGLAIITFVPASNLLFATGTIMGERLVYLPSAGLAAIAACALAALATTPSRLTTVTVVAALIVAGYGVRTYARNPDWNDDISLWRSAVASAPASAKAHRALAEALYDADPSHANLDAVLAEADRAVALLEPLPDGDTSFQAFRQAGAYYVDKANRASDAQVAGSAERRRLYSRALNLLDRAVVIARAQSGQLSGAMEPEADAQRLRAAALLGLENGPLALVAANRARQLSPMSSLGYRLAASALLALNRADEAAMMLLTGSIVSGDAALGQQAIALYMQGLDPDGCAIRGTGSDAALDPQCPTVRRHSCVASAAAYQILARAGQTQRAAQIRTSALTDLACPSDLMDRSNGLVP